MTFDSCDYFDALLSWVKSDQAVAQSGYFFTLFGVANCSWRGSVTPWPGLLPNPLSDHLRCSSAQPNAVQPSSFSHSSFSCPDIFILLLKLLRAHYLRGRNAGLIVWWLQRLDPFFSLCNQPTLASCLMFSSQCQAMRGLSRRAAQHGPWALFSLPQALRADYKPLACLPILQTHCFSLSTTWLSGLRGLQHCSEALVAPLAFVRGTQEPSS